MWRFSLSLCGHICSPIHFHYWNLEWLACFEPIHQSLLNTSLCGVHFLATHHTNLGIWLGLVGVLCWIKTHLPYNFLNEVPRYHKKQDARTYSQILVDVSQTQGNLFKGITWIIWVYLLMAREEYCIPISVLLIHL